MNVDDILGTSTNRDLYRTRATYARTLHEQGVKLIAYTCCYTPIEIITASGLVPFRMTGEPGRSLVHADRSLEIIVCPFLRNIFEMKPGGEYDFLDGLVMSNACDNINFSYTVFDAYWKPAFTHFLDIPHKIDSSAQIFYRSEFERFRHALSEYAGRDVTDIALRHAVELHSTNRLLLRELNNLRKKNPPPVSASKVMQLTMLNLGIPVEEGNQLLKDAIERIKSEAPGPPTKRHRLLLWGSHFDNYKILDLIEGCGADVVADDHCMGSRNYLYDVEITSDPMTGLTEYYSKRQVCARTFRDGLEDRFGHLRKLAADFDVDGAILYVMRYCDPSGFEVPFVSKYLKNIGIPVLIIDDDYTGSALAQIKTRVQAFLEILE